VKGRIDHLAVDAARQRLYVAELGNDSVGVLDLKERKLLRTLPGFREPQGIAYEPSTDIIYVANAGDGSVRLLHGEDLTPAGVIELGEDADNIRIDVHSHRVLVGYGNGALAVIDPVGRQKIVDIPMSSPITIGGFHCPMSTTRDNTEAIQGQERAAWSTLP